MSKVVQIDAIKLDSYLKEIKGQLQKHDDELLNPVWLANLKTEIDKIALLSRKLEYCQMDINSLRDEMLAAQEHTAESGTKAVDPLRVLKSEIQGVKLVIRRVELQHASELNVLSELRLIQRTLRQSGGNSGGGGVDKQTLKTIANLSAQHIEMEAEIAEMKEKQMAMDDMAEKLREMDCLVKEIMGSDEKDDCQSNDSDEIEAGFVVNDPMVAVLPSAIAGDNVAVIDRKTQIVGGRKATSVAAAHNRKTIVATNETSTRQTSMKRFVSHDELSQQTEEITNLIRDLSDRMALGQRNKELARGISLLENIQRNRTIMKIERAWWIWKVEVEEYRDLRVADKQALAREFVAFAGPPVFRVLKSVFFRNWAQNTAKLRLGSRMRLYLTDILQFWLKLAIPSKKDWFNRWKRITKVCCSMNTQAKNDLSVLNGGSAEQFEKEEDGRVAAILSSFCSMACIRNEASMINFTGEIMCNLAIKLTKTTKSEKQLRHEVSVLTQLIGNIRKELEAKVGVVQRNGSTQLDQLRNYVNNKFTVQRTEIEELNGIQTQKSNLLEARVLSLEDRAKDLEHRANHADEQIDNFLRMSGDIIRRLQVLEGQSEVAMKAVEVSTAEIAQAYKNSNAAMEQLKRVEDITGDNLLFFDGEIKSLKKHHSHSSEQIKDIVVGQAQICSHMHGTDMLLEDFMKDMQEVARFAVPSAPSPVELDRLCAEFEEKVMAAHCEGDSSTKFVGDMAVAVAKFAHRVADHFSSMADIELLQILIAGTKEAADAKGGIDTPLTRDDCALRRNELITNFIAGFVSLLKKRDPEPGYARSQARVVFHRRFMVALHAAMSKHELMTFAPQHSFQTTYSSPPVSIPIPHVLQEKDPSKYAPILAPGNAKKRPDSATRAKSHHVHRDDNDLENCNLFFAKPVPPVTVATASYEIHASNRPIENGHMVPLVVLDRALSESDLGPSLENGSQPAQIQKMHFEDHGNTVRSEDSHALLEHWKATAYSLGVHKKILSGSRPASGNATNLARSKLKASLKMDVIQQMNIEGSPNVFGSGFKMALRTPAVESLPDKLLAPIQRDVSIPQLGAMLRPASGKVRDDEGSTGLMQSRKIVPHHSNASNNTGTVAGPNKRPSTGASQPNQKVYSHIEI